MNENTVEFIEVVFARSEWRRGRFLRIGQEDTELFLVLNEVITNRFGANGVTDVIDPDGYWLGLPILYQGNLKYYLLGTFEKPSEEDRSAPFHGCLLTADKFKETKYNLTPFINAWRKLRKEGNQNSSWLSHETAGKVKFVLGADLEPEQHNNAGLTEQNFKILGQGNVVRLSSKGDIFALLSRMAGDLPSLSTYSWSTAPFAFPSDHDGAQMHICLSKDGKFSSVKEVIQPIDVNVDNSNENKPVSRNNSLLNSGQVNPPKKIYKLTFASIKSALISKASKYVLSIIVIIPITILVMHLNQDDSTDPKYISRLLDPSNELSFEEDIKSVEKVNEFFKSPNVAQVSKTTIDSQGLVNLRINRTNTKAKELVSQNYENLIKPPVLNWSLVTNKLPNGQKLQQELVISAIPSIDKALKDITNPDTKSKSQLQGIIQITENYNYPELSSLKKTASDTNNWFHTLIKASENEKNPKDSYSVLSIFVQSNPNSNFLIQAHDLQQKYLARWQQEATTNLKTLYESMIWQTGESPIDIDFKRLTDELIEYKRIPGIQMGKNFEIVPTLDELIKRTKTIKLTVEDFNFKESLNEKLDEINCRKLRSHQEYTESSYDNFMESTKKLLIPCPKNDHTVELVVNEDSLPIKDDGNSIISMPVLLNRNITISIKKQNEILATANFQSDLIIFWLKNKGVINTIFFQSNDGETLATATYKTPSPDEIGFPHWR